MPNLQLIIANKNYSSWSMRPWVALKQAEIAFEEIALSFDESRGGLEVAGIERYTPAKKVPVLLIDGDPVWDSLAIIESAAELFPDKRLWPADARARRLARAICAEMHSGFHHLRMAMPMNIRSRHPGKGYSPAVQSDIARMCDIWQECRTRFGDGGPLLFGEFCAADACFAPVVMRFDCYVPPLPPHAKAYCEAVRQLAAVQAWCALARQETAFVASDEPYADRPGK